MMRLIGGVLLLAAARTEVLGDRCTAETWATGRWLQTGEDFEAPVGDNATLEAGPGLWEWQPDCEVEEITAKSARDNRLCAVLKDANLRSVLLLGDSITGHQFDHFPGAPVALLPHELKVALSSCSDKAMNGVTVGNGRYMAKHICGAHSGLRMTFVRTDYLSTRLDGYREAKGGTSEPWADAQLLTNYGVVVVNSGAHHLEDAAYEELMEEAAAFLEAHVPPPRVLVYRDTLPGHGDCMNLTRPFRSVDEAERWIEEHPWYTSATVQGQNAAARRIFERHGFVRLNAYDVTVLRGDVHRSPLDCVHFNTAGARGIYHAWSTGLALLLRDV